MLQGAEHPAHLLGSKGTAKLGHWSRRLGQDGKRTGGSMGLTQRLLQTCDLGKFLLGHWGGQRQSQAR